MGFPPLPNLPTAAMPGQTTKTALKEEFMFQNVAYWPTVYRTGAKSRLIWLLKISKIRNSKLGFVKICDEQLIGRRTHIVSSDCLQIKHKNYYISSISCVFFIAFGRRHFVHKLKHGWHFEMTSSFHLQKENSVGL